jgi:CubicO group peptidase (beta-lactamase class C family)
VASLTKLVTAVCVLQVVEKGLVSLDDDLGAVVSELKRPQILSGFDENGAPILVESSKLITLRFAPNTPVS